MECRDDFLDSDLGVGMRPVLVIDVWNRVVSTG